ncbi:hypothetical protein PVK06_020575 [Gossypium arboreum]|uniref:Protein kinase domain-containing protein n=1 Tax=Gossypium arboreum TaxID=29729 RepID=A0ABR0PN43_GOSAR|nr:hypothetical protein PVK06_020575 [Gossypium arboreum]
MVATILVTLMIIIILFIGRRLLNKVIKGQCEEERCPGILSRNVLRKCQRGVQLQELQVLDFENLAAATNNFDPANKLGKGGFGVVYKGKFQDGQEVAVKRLSRASRQGIEEFTNEATVISQLQHRNLVRLLGSCIDGEEKMLVYEYMPNKSLDIFLFDSHNAKLLDWRKRFNIIEGISRDPAVSDSSFDGEILKCIHVGLLCMQNFATDRPTMSTVTSMLSTETENLPAPKQPPFIDEKAAIGHFQLQSQNTWER